MMVSIPFAFELGNGLFGGGPDNIIDRNDAF
jgi:hypothetical protein